MAHDGFSTLGSSQVDAVFSGCVADGGVVRWYNSFTSMESRNGSFPTTKIEEGYVHVLAPQ